MIHLIQFKCPANHCLAALPYDPGELTLEKAKTLLTAAMRENGVEMLCGICYSRELHFDDRQTPWKTLAEATPHLLIAKTQQLATRSAIHRARATAAASN